MGVVWLAERCDGQFDGLAAVKLLATRFDRSEARFRREATILARVTHPNIAHLIDAGVSSDGQPYLILEFVEGQPIDEYCDDRRLSVRSRIALFLDVLGAVAHAHTHRIVHRDIKPPNVLVRTDGHVKLLDFGIAKLLEPDGQPSKISTLTLEHGAGLTPAYAAPEQVRGGSATTATDIYALGLLLYLLLTGQHPCGEFTSPADLFKAIVDVDAPPPSASVVAGKAPANDLATRAARARPPRAPCTSCSKAIWIRSLARRFRRIRWSVTVRWASWPTTCAGTSPRNRSARAANHSAAGRCGSRGVRRR